MATVKKSKLPTVPADLINHAIGSGAYVRVEYKGMKDGQPKFTTKPAKITGSRSFWNLGARYKPNFVYLPSAKLAGERDHLYQYLIHAGFDANSARSILESALTAQNSGQPVPIGLLRWDGSTFQAAGQSMADQLYREELMSHERLRQPESGLVDTAALLAAINQNLQALGLPQEGMGRRVVSAAKKSSRTVLSGTPHERIRQLVSQAASKGAYYNVNNFTTQATGARAGKNKAVPKTGHELGKINPSLKHFYFTNAEAGRYPQGAHDFLTTYGYSSAQADQALRSVLSGNAVSIGSPARVSPGRVSPRRVTPPRVSPVNPFGGAAPRASAPSAAGVFAPRRF